MAGLDDSFAFFFLLYLRCAFCFPAALGAALLLLGDAVLPLGAAVFAGILADNLPWRSLLAWLAR